MPPSDASRHSDLFDPESTEHTVAISKYDPKSVMPELDHDLWFKSLHRAVAAPDEEGNPTDTSHDILIFVHGYRTSWANAVKRSAQFSYDLEFDGHTVVYTWPSQDKLLAYTVDETNAAWAAPHFTELLRELLANSGARRVHIVAHSMGNRITTEALRGSRR